MLNDILNEKGLIRVWSKIKSLISGSIGNATLTIKQNNNTVGTFTSNATTNVDVNITVPTHTSDLINDGEGGSPVDTFVKQSEIVQSDWNQNDEEKLDYIKNKPETIKGLADGSIRGTNTDEESSSYHLGENAVALGKSTNASGDASFVTGYGSKAEGNYSTASGYQSYAMEDFSQADGYSTSAGGAASHTEGAYTIANNMVEHAQGQYNVSNTDGSKVFNGSGDNTLFSIGNGTASPGLEPINSKNAVEVMQNGDMYVQGIGGYTGNNYSEASTLQEYVNIQPDWNQNDETKGDYIKNKPENIVQDADYHHTDNNYTTIEKEKLASIESGAQVNIQSDWNQNDETADEYIKNRICFEEGKEIVNVDTEGETVIEIPEFDSDIDSTHTYKAICNENGEINMYDCEYIVATDSEKIIKNGKFALYVWKEGHEKTGATLYIEEEISSISIQEDYSLHKLDEKYIPDTIARKTYVDGVDQNLQQQIDAITSSTDVRDVVGTYAELLAYDTSVLFNNDVVKVLVDENKNNAISYYRWVITEGVGAWSYIGSQGPFYTKAESDSKYLPKFNLLLEIFGQSQCTIDSPDVNATYHVYVDLKQGNHYSFDVSWVGSITHTLFLYLKDANGNDLKEFSKGSGIVPPVHTSYTPSQDYIGAYILIGIHGNELSTINLSATLTESLKSSIDNNTNSIASLNDSVSEIQTITSALNEDVSFSHARLIFITNSDFVAGKYLSGSGNVRTTDNQTETLTDPIPIPRGVDIKFTGLKSNSSSASCVAFFVNATDTNCISGSNIKNIGIPGGIYTIEKEAIPENAKYVRFHRNTTSQSQSPARVFINTIDTLLKELETEQIESRIAALEKQSPDSFFPTSKYLPILANGLRAARVSVNSAEVTEEEQVQLLWFSDIHEQTTNMQRILDFHSKYSTYFRDILLSGDMSGSYWNTQKMGIENLVGYSSVLKVIGNHDTYGHDDVPAPSKSNVYKRFMGGWDYYQNIQGATPDIASWDVIQPSDAEINARCYYYKDYKNTNNNTILRLIILNSLVWDQNSSSYDSTQITWFESVLTEARTNNIPVLVSCHFPLHIANDRTSIEPFDCSFNSLDDSKFIKQGYGSTTTGGPFIDAVDNFIEDGGEFIAWLFGHTHTDQCGVYPSHHNQVYINIGAATPYGPNQDTERTLNTFTYDLFNVVSVDVYSKRLRIARMGVEYDRYFRHKGAMLIDYANGNLIGCW